MKTKGNTEIKNSERTIAVIGGKLQGTEVCYLARHAGIRTILIDIDPHAPASGICDAFICGDVIGEDTDVLQALKNADMVLPAMENDAVLEKLAELQAREGYRLAFDMDAYRISSSKRRSDELFHRLGVPSPRYYPEGMFPYFAKDDTGSGSHGSVRLDSPEQMNDYLKTAPEGAVIQEYIEGPSYSIEIIGSPGNYRTYEITQIHVDGGYDCNLVTVPCDELTPQMKEDFKAEAVKIAEEMELKGIMDFEVILHDGKMKMLEIDARIPSQTPAAVLRATGMNELEDLYDVFCTGGFRTQTRPASEYAAYEQYLYTDGRIESLGEHIMTEGGVLRLEDGFCGSDEAQTDWPGSEHHVVGGRQEYRVAFINSAKTRGELDKKREEAAKCLQNIQKHKTED
ncbi:MAG: 3-methylornithine--L-lysine ligase PylC [Clostridia bacterium]|nr:3-methylornithine--L-lysine ligase PylC [Clostridia bacterium]